MHMGTLCIVLSAYTLPKVADSELLSRIWYGTRANINDYPFFAGLAYCGAAIISDRWLITAAHCINGDRGPVWVGGESMQRSQKYRYIEAVIHPQYGTVSGYDIPVNDVALLRLSSPLTFSSTVKAITLPKHDYERDRVHAFAGKGENERDPQSKYLMTMNVRTLKKKQCLSYLPGYQLSVIKPYLKKITNVTICTKRVEDKPGLCFGDSGSPLVRNNILVGIASYISNPDCSKAKLGFFANVAPYVNWIKSVTGIK